ncbi:hypothetical protein [Actinoplanes sp. NPDC049802]|uniref:hypothetical protein n=1 Tax=Actinoplanes sp. NPDC049802 TaxID=3154742 RepID=UPI0033D8948D
MNRSGPRLEVAGAGLLLLRQAGVPVLFARVDRDLWGVDYVRTGRYRSVLPPIRAARAAAIGDSGSARWVHHFRRALTEPGYEPARTGRWRIGADVQPLRPGWSRSLLTDSPGWIDWFTHGGSGQVLPLRELSGPGDGRVKAYRKQARDGILPPVLLWWVSGLDCHLLLDGHDRLVAALAEDRAPAVLTVSAVDPARIARDTAAVADRYRHNDEALRARSVPEPVLVELGRQFARDLSAAEGAFGRTVAWPLPGGTAAWTRAAEECAPGWLASLG